MTKLKTDKEMVALWNVKYRKVISQGVILGLLGATRASFTNNSMADYCEVTIIKAKQAYYDTKEEIMTDQRYDKIEDILRELRPASFMLQRVGN